MSELPNKFSEAESVLVLLPTANDSRVACEILREADIKTYPCSDMEDLCENLERGCLAVLVSEEGLTTDAVQRFRCSLKRQERWSDLPVIILTIARIQQIAELFSETTNVSLLERPFSRLTFVRSVQVALRSRKKQYELRDLLLDLESSKSEAEKANTAKTHFLANMSHEIRTPIGAIMGFVDLLKSNDNSAEDKKNFMEIIDRNSQQLLRLIDDILDLSKVEAGKMVIEQVPFKLTDMLADFGSIMAFKAAEKGIVFRTVIDGLIPDCIQSDPVRLRQVISNVVGNAIKFTSYGSVEMKVFYKSNILGFEVRDTGVGLSAKQAANLFQPFVQADTSTTRKFGGTGLGLVLSRSLARNLGGDLKLLRSTEETGSVFLAEIKPVLTEETKMVSGAAISLEANGLHAGMSRKALQGLHVLLVEDSPDNQMLIKTYLRKHGATVDSATDGAEGVNLAITKKYDVILMDIQMPVLDGHEATKKLRLNSYDKPIIALTAHAMKEERLKCFESGFTDFLTKPVQAEQLVEVLSRYQLRQI